MTIYIRDTLKCDIFFNIFIPHFDLWCSKIFKNNVWERERERERERENFYISDIVLYKFDFCCNTVEIKN